MSSLNSLANKAPHKTQKMLFQIIIDFYLNLRVTFHTNYHFSIKVVKRNDKITEASLMKTMRFMLYPFKK
eukprot:snap_masked-scaffold_4-processed-gene-15.7-mRNA-1 protein AED:1.00 eAED:1.00 QI:0/0/0/0/1/1/2/0/69